MLVIVLVGSDDDLSLVVALDRILSWTAISVL